MHHSVKMYTSICILNSVAFLIYGFLVGAPGALPVTTVYLVWPLVYIVFILSVTRLDNLILLLKTVVVGSIVVSIISILLVVDTVFGIGLGMREILAEQGAIVDYSGGNIAFRLFNMSTVVYAVPFLIANSLLPRSLTCLTDRWRLISFVALMLAICVLIISGRRAFWLVSMLSPLIALTLMYSAGIRADAAKFVFKFLTVATVAFIAVLPLFEIDLAALFEDFIDGFDFSLVGSESSVIRRIQYVTLIEGWKHSPLIGHGLGSHASHIFRETETPWAYELSYVSLLYQVGLVGLIVYSFSIVWMFWKSIQLVKIFPKLAGVFIPLLTGLTCFLIATSTNPYLQKFDYLWTIFLPLCVLNVCLMRMRNRAPSK